MNAPLVTALLAFATFLSSYQHLLNALHSPSSYNNMYTCYSMHNVLKHAYIHVNHDLLMLMYLIEGLPLQLYSSFFAFNLYKDVIQIVTKNRIDKESILFFCSIYLLCLVCN